MSNKLLLAIIRGFVSFVLAMTVFVSVIGLWALNTILDYDKISGYIKDESYAMLYTEVCENIAENTVSTGLPEEILTAPLNKEIIAYELNASLKSLYNSEKYQLQTTSLKDDYKSIITEYAKENGIELDEAATDSLVNYLINLIQESIKIPFSNTLSPYFVLMQGYIGKLALIMLAISIAISTFLFFLCRPRAVMLRYIGRAFMCNGILGGFVSLYVITKEMVSSVNIASLAYSNAILSISQKTFSSLLVISVAFFVIGLALSIIPCNELNEEKDEGCSEVSSPAEAEQDETAQADA